ncbi:TonB-dependent receptor domain-containing protein [Agarivorans albus]|uniref:Outer membrane vitamin B12 receptor BtuB n=1 Tax=Agarivorans albus MKT 106 TaxID=1331007 RepID=R9PFA9_AGAAL|nr:TonB-dependent receptor [Agarivorans albus]GAC99922.1 outer membrane vitamin B12 receptor BtuB [Agarivorans albus MKT 106]
MKKFILLAAVAPAFGYAQETQQAPQTEQPATMVVTANRMEQTEASVIAPLTVVSRSEIESSGAQDIIDVLSQQVGISVTRNGGKGHTESVFIRGTSSAQSLFLIDGVRINTATNGGAQLSLLPLEFVERIEILRGARASIYGADAVGGVINIITRPSFGSEYHGLKAAVGTQETVKLAARASGQLDDATQYNVIFSKDKSNGYDIRPQDNLDEDYGYDTFGGLLSLDHEFNQAWRGRVFLLLNDSESEFIQGGKALTKHKQTVYGASVNYAQDRINSEFALNSQQDQSDTAPADNFVDPQRYSTERVAANWLLGYQLNQQWLLQGGLDYQKDDISGTSLIYQQESRDNKAAHIGTRADYDQHTLEGSLRYDDNEHYGDHTTYNLGWAWQFQPSMRFNALHGTAFRAPTFNDLYYPGSENPSLKAETSTNSELGLELNLLQSQWQLNVFRNDVDNLIAWGCVARCDNDYTGTPDTWPLWTPDNVSDARIQGIEFQGEFSTAWVNHRVIVEFLDPKDRSTDKNLIRRPEEQVKYKADMYWQSLQVVVDFLWRGDSYEDAANTTTIDSHSIWDLSANYKFASGLRVDAKLRNVFDKQYSTVNDYQAQGRTFELGASYQF